MAAQPQERVRKRLVWFSPYLFVIVLSSPVLQGISCSPATGDATLSTLEVEVLGQNQISAFDPDQRIYDVWLPLSADTAIVRAYSTDPDSTVSYALYEVNIPTGTLDTIDYGYFPVGGGEVTLTGLLPEGRSQLYITVRAPGGAKILYAAIIQVGCSDCDDDDGNECTINSCEPVVEQCVLTPVADDTACDFGGEIGTCVSGVCEMGFPCTEQGILDAIALGGGPHTFACSGPTTVTTQGEIFIYNDVILDGGGNLTVQVNIVGGPGYRVFSVPAGVTAELVGMTIRGGAEIEGDGFDGGAIFSEGTLTLRNSSVVDTGMFPDFYGGNSGGGGIYSTGVLILQSSNVEGNTYWDHYGGGIYSTGVAFIENSVIADNCSYGGGCGGGIYNTGELTVLNSKIEGNASSWAGGICSVGGTLTVRNSTVSGNVGDNDGYRGNTIYSDGIAIFESSTVSNNRGEGAVAMSFHGSTSMVNTSVSGNEYGINGSGTMTLNSSTIVVATSTSFPDQIDFSGELHVRNSIIVASNPSDAIGACAFPIISEGYNIESNGNSCGFTDPSDLVNVTAAELNLGPLADNGGPTTTHALLPGSVAIDRIPEALCVDADGLPLTTDQRGVARPQGATCDVGAFEWVDCESIACEDGNVCTSYACNSSTGLCQITPVPDGTPCSPAPQCDPGDGMCSTGVCESTSGCGL